VRALLDSAPLVISCEDESLWSVRGRLALPRQSAFIELLVYLGAARLQAPEPLDPWPGVAVDTGQRVASTHWDEKRPCNLGPPIVTVDDTTQRWCCTGSSFARYRMTGGYRKGCCSTRAELATAPNSARYSSRCAPTSMGKPTSSCTQGTSGWCLKRALWVLLSAVDRR
jgi:hypothetical protein